jgi:uncharacterized membrane protein HdeD (DUF308 family)
MSTASAADQNYASASPQESLQDTLAHNWWIVALRGVLGILFGIVAFVLPGVTMLSLVIVFAAYLLADGILAIISAVRAARRRDRWGLLTFEGIVSIITAVAAVLLPGLTVIVFVMLVAAWAIITGALMLRAAFRINIDHGRWWLALGGVASVVYGVLLIVAPLIGALVLTWWLGAYAMVFGIALVVLAFRLRSKQGPARRATVAPGAA